MIYVDIVYTSSLLVVRLMIYDINNIYSSYLPVKSYDTYMIGIDIYSSYLLVVCLRYDI